MFVLILTVMANAVLSESQATINGNAAIIATSSVTWGHNSLGQISGTKIEVSGSAQGSLFTDVGAPNEPWDEIEPIQLKIEVIGTANGVGGNHVIWDIGQSGFSVPFPGAPIGPSANRQFRFSSVVFPDGDTATIKVTAKYRVTDTDTTPDSVDILTDISVLPLHIYNKAGGWKTNLYQTPAGAIVSAVEKTEPIF